MYLPDRIKNDIKYHALEEEPKECCGFLIFSLMTNRLEIVKCKNIAENPFIHAKPHKNDYLSADYSGEIKAFYHSHYKREDFSEYDKQKCEFNELPYILYCVNTGEISFLNPEGVKNKYIDLEFIWGQQDCFSLIRNYYKNELNIEIKDYVLDRQEDWWKNGENVVEKYKEENHFYEVMEKEPNDLIIFEFNKNQFHFAIYLGDNNIIHHPRGKKSIIEPLNEKLGNKIKYVLRNKLIQYV